MKKLYIFIILLLLPLLFYAQSEQWSDPVPITDSLTDNRNVTLSTSNYFYNQYDTLYACWEKSTDTISTALYWRRLLPLGDPGLLLSQPNVHFRNPRIYKYNTGDTAFGVYFQTNMNGNWDIYYVCYLRNGSVSPMIPVRTTAEDETNFHFDMSNENLPEMVWEQNGRILYKRSNTDTIQIDKDDCHNPLIGNNHIYWTKIAGGNVYINCSIRNSSTGNWGSPVGIYGQAYIEHLSIGNDTHGNMIQGDLVWEHKDGTFWRLMAFDPSFSTQYPFPDFNSSNNIFPSYLGVFFITDHPQYLDNAFKTFSSDTTGNAEIWVTPGTWSSGYINISNYGNTDTHPQLFDFFTAGTNHLYDIWESWRNGHWQLWMTNMDIATGIEEKLRSDNSSVFVYPNPFQEETTIDFYTDEPGPVCLTIYTTLGDKVSLMKSMNEGIGKVSFKWNGRSQNGYKLASGVYFCCLKTNTRSIQKKIVIF